MLQITIPGRQMYDEKNNEFIYEKELKLQLEHSLVSISKWESKWHKPFLGKEQLTHEETVDYIKCMTITQNVDPEIYNRLSSENIAAVENYIEAPMTATWFPKEGNGKGKNSGEAITNELIYYWMISLNIPLECQKWHLNRLFTLIKVCNAKNKPSKKMSKQEALNQQRALNAARRKQFSSKG